LKKFSNNTRVELVDILAKVKNSLDVWVTFLTRHDLLNRNNLPVQLDDPALKKALNVLEVMNFNVEEREAYEDHIKWLRMENSAFKKQEAKGFEAGIQIGLEKGEQIGLEKGEQIGLEKGEHIGIVKGIQKTVCNMFHQGMSLEDISAYTELSIDQIKSLVEKYLEPEIS
jgi:predicted transposase/invertase (TIGR01784 family)